jgi:hypothetical protein
MAALAAIAEVETRMVAVLADLGLDRLVTTIPRRVGSQRSSDPRRNW